MKDNFNATSELKVKIEELKNRVIFAKRESNFEKQLKLSMEKFQL